MTRDLASQHRLAESLRARARGIYPDEAAIELLICHDTFLRRGDFTRHITTGEHDHRGNGAGHAAIDWAAAATALDAGRLVRTGRRRRLRRPRRWAGHKAAGSRSSPELQVPRASTSTAPTTP